MIQAVLFDLDGTLLDRDASLKKFVEAQYVRFIEHLSHIPQDIYVSRFIELDNRGYVWKDKVYQRLIKECSITGLTWEDLLDDYRRAFPKHCVPFPGLNQMITELHKLELRLGIITNGRGSFQMANIRALGIESFLSVILVSELEGISKPDIQIFERALKKLGVKANHSVFVGDHPRNDISAARQAGMKAIWKKDPIWSEPEEVDGMIDDLMELLPLVAGGLKQKIED